MDQHLNVIPTFLNYKYPNCYQENKGGKCGPGRQSPRTSEQTCSVVIVLGFRSTKEVRIHIFLVDHLV